MRKILTKEEVRSIVAKYKVGDIVVYLDNNKVKKIGTINDIEWTDNDTSTPLYLIDGCSYLRKQKDILEKCIEVIPKYKVESKVYYVDDKCIERVGKIKSIEKTDVSIYNSIIEPLYLISGCPYLRDENDIHYECITVEDDFISNYIQM